MGYFPNGSAGDAYEAQYCARCVHQSDEGCAVMLAHVLYAYEECGSRSNAEHILKLLIPEREDGFNAQCAMFLERGPSAGSRRVRLPLVEDEAEVTRRMRR
jgi:hypothetical protein